VIAPEEQLFERLLAMSPLSTRELVVLIQTAPNRYKEHFIDKRHGRGKRLISQPTAELKFFQRYLIKEELASLPIHSAATAYQSGHSIKSHATPHAAGAYLMKLDFKDFFPSLKEKAIRYRLSKDTNYTDAEQWILCQLLCRRPTSGGALHLSIGAPSSPFLSNYLMWEFDEKLSNICAGSGVIYTRYADDLAFSTSKPHLLDVVLSAVNKLIAELSYLGLSLNRDKTVNVSKKNRRTLTGLTLSNQGTVSIGREQKRLLRATIHAYCLNKLPKNEVAKLRGQLAFVYSIDRIFVIELLTRSGLSSLNEIQ